MGVIAFIVLLVRRRVNFVLVGRLLVMAVIVGEGKRVYGVSLVMRGEGWLI